MTHTMEGFLPRDTQKLPLQRNLGDAFSAIAKHLFPFHTAKLAGEEMGLDPSTAKNAVKGVAGGAAITRALHHRQSKHDDHWALWDALGTLIFGESRDEYDERKLAARIEETTNAQSLAEERRRRRAVLDERTAAVVAAERRSFAREDRGRGG